MANVDHGPLPFAFTDPAIMHKMKAALRFTALVKKRALLVVNNTLAYRSVHTVPQYTIEIGDNSRITK